MLKDNNERTIGKNKDDIKTPESEEGKKYSFEPSRFKPRRTEIWVPPNRSKGLSYSDFQTLIKLKGLSYAMRIRAYMNSDPKYRVEILTNKKVDPILRKLLGTTFEHLVEYYYRSAHPKFIKMIKEMEKEKGLPSTKKTRNYLYHILVYLYQIKLKQKIPNRVDEELRSLLQVSSHSQFNIKQQLVTSNVIGNIDLNLRKKWTINSVMQQTIEILAELANFLPPEIDHRKYVNKARELLTRFDLVKSGTNHLAEAISVLSIVIVCREYELPRLKVISNLINDDGDGYHIVQKIYRIRKKVPEIDMMFDDLNFAKHRQFTFATLEVDQISEILKPEVEVIPEQEEIGEVISLENYSGTVEVVRIDKENLAEKTEFTPVPEEVTRIIDGTPLNYYVPGGNPTIGFMNLALYLVENHEAKILADDSDKNLITSKFGLQVFSKLKNAFISVDEVEEYQTNYLISLNEEGSDSGRMVKLMAVPEGIPLYSTRNVMEIREALSESTKSRYILDLQDQKLLDYARSVQDKPTWKASRMITPFDQFWVAWGTYGAEVIGRAASVSLEKKK